MRGKTHCRQYQSYHLEHLDRIEQYLEEKAREGWMVYKHLGGFFWFQKEEPQDIQYYVEVFEKERWNNSYENRVNQAYIKECGRKGWKFVNADSHFQIMRCENSKVPKPKLISSGKIESIYKSCYKEYFYLLLCLMVMALANMFFSFTGVTKMLSSLSQLIYVSAWAVLAVYLVCYMLSQKSWYKRALASAQSGRGIPDNPRHRYLYIGLLCTAVMLAVSIIGFFIESHTYSSGKAFIRCLILLAVVLLWLVLLVVREKSKSWKQGVLGGIAVIMACLSVYTLAIRTSSIFEEVHTTKQAKGALVYQDVIPITLSSLKITTDSNITYSRYHQVEGEFLIKEDYYSEEPVSAADSKAPSLCYLVYRTDNSTLYHRVFEEECFAVNAKSTYEEIKNSKSKANAVYKKKLDSGYYEYIFAFEKQIIKININIELSSEQIETIQTI